MFPSQDAELISCHLCHSQLVKVDQCPLRSKDAGECLDHRAENHAGRRERLFHLPLENIICPTHWGNSSPGWPSVFLVSPCPSFYSPFYPPRQALVSCVGEAPPCSRAPSLLFASLHQRKELTDLLHSLALKPSTGTSDQISINYDRVLHLLATPEGAIDLRSVKTTSVKSQPPRYVLLSRGCAVAGNVRGVPENLAPTDTQW